MRFPPHVLEFQKKVSKAYEKDTPLFFHGAYGDMENCIGIIENTMDAPGGGKQIKLWGCSYLYKGFPEDFIIDGGSLSLAKGMISRIPREIIAPSAIYKGALVLKFIFAKKKLYSDLQKYFQLLCDYAIDKNNITDDKLNANIKEIRRAIHIVAQKRELPWLLPLGRFIAGFLQYDGAYKFRMQDIFGEVNLTNVRKNIRKEILRLLDIMIEREDGGITHKWKSMRIILNLALIVSSDMRNAFRTFFLEIDLDKVKLDEADWYFCLQRGGYNFKGRSLKDRLALRKRIDKKKGHILVKGVYEIKTIKTPRLNVEVPNHLMLKDEPLTPQGVELGDKPVIESQIYGTTK